MDKENERVHQAILEEQDGNVSGGGFGDRVAPILIKKDILSVATVRTSVNLLVRLSELEANGMNVLFLSPNMDTTSILG